MQVIATSNLDRQIQWANGYTDGERNLPFNVSGQRLIFNNNGLTRLVHTIGLLEGMAMGDKREAAEKLANLLAQRMEYLGNYGGDTEVPGSTRPMPAFKIILGDDGNTGSFSVRWFNLVDPQRIKEAFDNRDKDGDYSDFKTKLFAEWKILEDLKEWNSEFHDYQYAYRFNGGMIMHYDKDITEAHWGIHT